MRITSRLRILSAASMAVLLGMGAVVAWSGLDFRAAKAQYTLANDLKSAFLECNSSRDQYFLHRETRLEGQWQRNRDRAEALLREAQVRFPETGDQEQVARMAQDLLESSAIFQRIVDNTAPLEAGGDHHAVLEELDKRLSSQLLLKAAAAYDTARDLRDASANGVEHNLRRMTLLIGLFATALASVTILGLGQVIRLIRQRLVPLHAGVRIVAGGDLDFRLPAEGGDELAELARSINAMTDQLQVANRQLGEEIGKRILAVARQESEARFRAWFELPLVGFNVSSLDKGWLEVNSHLCAMLGYSREELTAMTWADLTHPDDLAKDLALFQKMVRGELEGYTLDKRFLRKDGSVLYAELATRCLRGSPDTFVAVILDVTERKRAEEEQRRLTDQLHQAQKMDSIGSLAGGVAHDMNNVLAAILGLASAHLELQPPDSPAAHAFGVICLAAERGGTLVKRLLGFARKSLAEETVLDLNAILREEAGILERTTLSRVRLVLELAPGLSSMRGDAAALSHAFMNLCVNAVEAMADGGTLTLRTREGGPGWIEVEVEDDGAGMAREVLDKALDPFFTTKETGKGTGLGLSMVYSTVKAHRGQLELRSEPGRGTLVKLRFPSHGAAAQAPAAPRLPLSPGKARKVLLVDDDPLLQSSTGILLALLGHVATVAASGEEALAQLQEGLEPDVVILDLNMPGLGGAGTLPRLRALRPELPVLLATGRVDQTALDLVAGHARVTLMSKPFSFDELREKLGGGASY